MIGKGKEVFGSKREGIKDEGKNVHKANRHNFYS
jgi:hypothetical protein